MEFWLQTNKENPSNTALSHTILGLIIIVFFSSQILRSSRQVEDIIQLRGQRQMFDLSLMQSHSLWAVKEADETLNDWSGSLYVYDQRDSESESLMIIMAWMPCTWKKKKKRKDREDCPLHCFKSNRRKEYSSSKFQRRKSSIILIRTFRPKTNCIKILSLVRIAHAVMHNNDNIYVDAKRTLHHH